MEASRVIRGNVFTPMGSVSDGKQGCAEKVALFDWNVGDGIEKYTRMLWVRRERGIILFNRHSGGPGLDFQTFNHSISPSFFTPNSPSRPPRARNIANGRKRCEAHEGRRIPREAGDKMESSRLRTSLPFVCAYAIDHHRHEPRRISFHEFVSNRGCFPSSSLSHFQTLPTVMGYRNLR